MQESHVQSLKSHMLLQYLSEDFFFILSFFLLCLAQQGSGILLKGTRVLLSYNK